MEYIIYKNGRKVKTVPVSGMIPAQAVERAQAAIFQACMKKYGFGLLEILNRENSPAGDFVVYVRFSPVINLYKPTDYKIVVHNEI